MEKQCFVAKRKEKYLYKDFNDNIKITSCIGKASIFDTREEVNEFIRLAKEINKNEFRNFRIVGTICHEKDLEQKKEFEFDNPEFDWNKISDMFNYLGDLINKKIEYKKQLDANLQVDDRFIEDIKHYIEFENTFKQLTDEDKIELVNLMHERFISRRESKNKLNLIDKLCDKSLQKNELSYELEKINNPIYNERVVTFNELKEIIHKNIENKNKKVG